MLKYQNFKIIESVEYKYNYILFKVNSENDLEKLYDFLESYFNNNIKCERKFITEYEIFFPNYILISSKIINKIDINVDNYLYVYSFDSIDIDILKEYAEDQLNEINTKEVYDANSLYQLKMLFKNGMTKSKVVNYNEPKQLVYESNKYKYNSIWVKLNSENELTKLYDFLDSLLGEKKIERSLSNFGIQFPNYFRIYSNILNDEYKHLGWLSEDPEMIDELLDEYIYEPNDVDSHIYTIKELTKIKSILVNGVILPSYNEPRELVYENMVNKYPYKYISMIVYSRDEVIKIYDYLESIDCIPRRNRNLIENIHTFPNYVFFYIQDFYNDKNEFTITYLGTSPNQVMIDRNITNDPYCDKDILTIKDLPILKNILLHGKKSPIINYNEPKKLVYESSKYEYNMVIVKVDDTDDIIKIYDFIDKTFNITTDRYLISRINNFPNYVYIPTNIDRLGDSYIYLSSNTITDWMIQKYIIDDNKVDNDILTMNELYKLKPIINNGTKKFNVNYNEPKKLVYESKDNSNILYAFDFDETLVFSERFEEKVKDLLLEYVTPETIFLNKLDIYNVDISKLKYENGRIYFNDPKHEFDIDDYNQDWVRKKDRVYFTQPEEYLLSDESTPIGSYKKIVDLYNSVDNKCIITARKEKLRGRTERELDQFGIETPNYGLFMFVDSRFSIKSKYKCDVLLDLYYDNNFDEIHYFDDNIKLLKRMKEYLNEFDVNIKLYKVTKNEYRLI